MKQRILAWLLAAALCVMSVCPALAVGEPPKNSVSASDQAEAETAGHDDSELVEVIVTLEGDPLLLAGGGDAAHDELLAEQEAVLEQISGLTGEDESIEARHYVTAVNAMSLTLPWGIADQVEQLDGVAQVYAAARFSPAESTQAVQTVEQTIFAGGMVNVETAWDQGYDGAGTVIAVIDTGLDLEHPAFDVEMDGASLALGPSGVSEVLEELHAYGEYAGLTAEDVSHGTKVPFAFNYADHSLDVSHSGDSEGDHGTHVAGIVAAAGEEGQSMGIAPGGQLLVMKVFGASQDSASEAVLLAALEDAILLGADVINLSLGMAVGFSSGGYAYTQAIENAAEAGIVVCAAAGNDTSSTVGNAGGTDLGTTSNIDIGAVSDPSSLTQVMSIASVNNNWVLAQGFFTSPSDGEPLFIPVSDSGAQFGHQSFETLAGRDNEEKGGYEYVVVPGVGRSEDFSRVDAMGRIALIWRGDIAFSEKCDNAFAAGAIAVIVCNTESEFVTMDLSGTQVDNSLPCVMISQEDGQVLVEEAGEDGMGALTVSAQWQTVQAEDGGQLSSFSSWGSLPDLTLKPDFSAVGGNVYSTMDGGAYGTMSGTSMAAPQASGMAALLLQHLRETYEMTGPEARERVQTLLMNTAAPVLQSDGVEYSPRKQGAGLANVGHAVTTPVWLTVNGSELPKAELGDDPEETGIYEFSFTAYNESDTAQSYWAEASLLTETAGNGLMLQKARKLDAEVTFASVGGTPGGGDAASTAVLVTVPAQGETQVTVRIKLTEAEKKALRETFENGIYVEGYVHLRSTQEEGVDLSIPILAFFGDWSRAPLFDQMYIAQLESAANENETLTSNSPYPFEIVTGENSYLGMNPVGQDTAYIPERSNALNATGEEGGMVSDLILDLLRSARHVTVEFLDSAGRTLYQSQADYVAKSCYQDAYQQMIPAVWSLYDEDFSFVPGDYGLSDGSTFTLRITGEKDTGGSFAKETIEFPCYVDGRAPQVRSVAVRAGEEADGRRLLDVTVWDNYYVAGVMVLSADGERELDVRVLDQKIRGASTTLTLDVTDIVPMAGGTLQIGVMDYAQNLTLHEVDVLLDGETTLLPEDTFYAYGADYDASGWYTVREGAEELPDGFLDYLGSVCAAESVGSYLFAAGSQNTGWLYAIDTTTFQPVYVCDLGLTPLSDEVLDLAYSQADGALYALVRKGAEYQLLRVDLSGETAELALTVNRELIGDLERPYALACAPDGTLMLLVGIGRPEALALCAVDPDTGTVDRLDQLGLELEESILSAVADQETGEVYFTYYREDWSHTETTPKVESGFYVWRPEGDGGRLDKLRDLPAEPYDALVLTGNASAEFPPDGEAGKVILSHHSRHLSAGRSFQLTVQDIRPWYVDGGDYEIAYSSADPSVAQVDQKGNVTARGAGSTEITVTLTQPAGRSVSAACRVYVEKPNDLMALLDGTWVTLDGQTLRPSDGAQLPSEGVSAAYAAGAGPEGQDVIFLLAPSGWDEVVDCPVYSLDSYDAESLELLEQRELSRSWYIRPEQLPEHGFRDMAYDPVSGYLTAVSDQLMVSIDLNQGRFYMAGDASRQLGGAELLGIAFDSDGNGWYADSAGAVGKVMSYLGAVELEPSGLVLPIGQDPGKRSGMEYDELSGRLWIAAGEHLYGIQASEGFRLFRSASVQGELSCLLIRHYPSGRN